MGDAVLVSFQIQSFENDFTTSEESAKDKETRQRNVLVRKAIECGLQLLARLSHYRVYLTAEERTKHRSSVGIDRRTRDDDTQPFFLFDGTGSTSEQSSTGGSLYLNTALDIDYTYDATAFNFWRCIPAIFGKNRKNKVYATGRKQCDK